MARTRICLNRPNGVADNAGSGSISLSAVNIEDDGDRLPVNYVLPPGIS